MSGACAAAAAAGVCFGARARLGTPRAGSDRSWPCASRPAGSRVVGPDARSAESRSARVAPRGPGPVAGDAPRRGFAPAAATRGRRAVARSARPEDAGKAQSGDAGEGSETNEPNTEATPHPDSGASSASSDDADAASAEPPREEIKYKPPGVSKRRSATKTVPIVVNPVPPSERVPGGAGAAPKDEDAADPETPRRRRRAPPSPPAGGCRRVGDTRGCRRGAGAGREPPSEPPPSGNLRPPTIRRGETQRSGD